MPLNRAGCRRPVRWLLVCAVTSGFLEGRCLRMAGYVAGMKPTGRAITAGKVLEVVYAPQA